MVLGNLFCKRQKNQNSFVAVVDSVIVCMGKTKRWLVYEHVYITQACLTDRYAKTYSQSQAKRIRLL